MRHELTAAFAKADHTFVNHCALKQINAQAVQMIYKKSMRLKTSKPALYTLYPIYLLFALGLPDCLQNAGIPLLHCGCQ